MSEFSNILFYADVAGLPAVTHFYSTTITNVVGTDTGLNEMNGFGIDNVAVGTCAPDDGNELEICDDDPIVNPGEVENTDVSCINGRSSRCKNFAKDFVSYKPTI